ncbi:MAG: hypothetical protein ACRBBS_09865 [Thalassovita sp.]
MIHTWPDTLPSPERNTWQVQPEDARRKRQAETGPPGYRRRWSNVARTVSLSVLLSRSQKAAFDQFFHLDCAEGAALFWMPDPTTDGWALLSSEGQPLLMIEGQPLLMSAAWLCHWGDQLPVETIEGREFRKTFSVEVMP